MGAVHDALKELQLAVLVDEAREQIERETIARVVTALQVRKATDPSNFIGWAELIDWLTSGAWKEDGDG